MLCLVPGNQNTWLLWNLVHFPKVMRADSYFHHVVSGSSPRHLTMLSLLCWLESLSPSYHVFAPLSALTLLFLSAPYCPVTSLSQRASWSPHPKYCAKLEFDEHITMYLPPQMGNKAFLPFIKAPVFCLESIHLHLCSAQHWFTSSF